MPGKDRPIILGIGRLTRQEDFHTLLRAFAIVRKERLCSLVILRDGEDLESLQALAREAGVASDVDFPGFQRNPFAWLARSHLFVLSSSGKDSGS